MKTDLRTLWSDTLIELLCDAVKREWSDNAIKEIIKELYNKGYKTEQLMALSTRSSDRKLLAVWQNS